MVSVASDGATDRIKARILFKVLRAGSGRRARYSSISFGAALRFAVEPRALAFAFFIRGILQKRSFPVHASDLSVRVSPLRFVHPGPEVHGAQLFTARVLSAQRVRPTAFRRVCRLP